MNRRSRLWAVLAIVLGGAVAIISSTQTWIQVTLSSGATDALEVPGAEALRLLAPLSLAALALGLALTVVGRVLRYIFGIVALVIGAALAIGAARVGITAPLDAIAAAVTALTGISGDDSVTELVAASVPTAWPFLAAAAGVLIATGGLVTLATAHRWHSGGRRYETNAPSPAAERPHDAIDSWDDLSRGDDPTSR